MNQLRFEKIVLLNFTYNFWKVQRKSVEFQSKFRVRLEVIPSRNHSDQYFEKNFKKNLKFYQKFEEWSQKLRTKLVKFSFT